MREELGNCETAVVRLGPAHTVDASHGGGDTSVKRSREKYN
jgi:hypothetical protein